MFVSSDIHTVTEFSRKPAEHISRLKQTGRPEVLTVNGKAAVVVQDAQAYEEMAKLADYASAIQSVRTALAESGRPLKDFAAEFETANGIVR